MYKEKQKQNKPNKTKKLKNKPEAVPGLYFKFSFVGFGNDPWLLRFIPVR